MTATSFSRNEIVFVDPNVSDWAALVATIKAGIEVVLLEPGQDGLVQIANALDGRKSIDAIHVVSHGDVGQLQLGSAVVDQAALAHYAGELAAIGSALDDEGDILLYGCDVANGAVGEAFITALAGYTSSDVAASDNATGAQALEGDWVLESRSGTIESEGFWGADISAYQYLLAMDQNFESEILGQSGATSKVYGSFNFYGNAGSNIAIINDGQIASVSDQAIRFDSNYNLGVTQVGFVTTDGSEYSLESLQIGSGVGDSAVIINGLRNGNSVYSAQLDLLTPSSDGGASYTGNNFGTITFTGWGYLDEVTISIDGPTQLDGLDIDLDDINVGAAVIPNSPPTALTLSSLAASHSDGVNGFVGKLTTTDPDAGDSHSYALVTGAGDTGNAHFSIINDELRVINPQAMTPGNYQLRIQSKDAAGASISEAFTISLADDIVPTVSTSPVSGTQANATTVDYNVIFSEAVTGVTVDDFELAQAGTSSGNITAVTGAGTHYTVSVGSLGGEGTLLLNLKGGTDISDGTNAPLSYSSGTAHTVNLEPPAVTDANISLSGGTGTGGTFKIGDTVTASWNNTASGDNNADVASATVDFSQFGGGAAVAATNSSGLWTATYTITSGAIDASNRNIAFTAIDTASNATTTADTSNASVDNLAPGAPTGTLAVDENSPNGTEVGTISSSDTDGLTYSLLNNAGGRFALDSFFGKVTVANASLIDYETDKSHDITVQATDNAGNVTSSVLSVSINDTNDAPSGGGGFKTTTLFDNAGPAALFDNLSVTDPDSGEASLALTLTLSNSSAGTISGGGFKDVDGGNTYTVFGLTVTQANTALDEARFTPTSNIGASGSFSTNMGVTVNDQGGVEQTVLSPTAVTITRVNDAPALSGLGAGPASVVAGSGLTDITLLDSVMLIDQDSVDFNGGTLTLSKTSGANEGGWGTGGKLFTNSQDVTIGAVANAGQDGNGLVISLDADATPLMVRDFIRSLQYQGGNTKETRGFTLNVTDGDGTANGGNDTAAANFSIVVQPNPPVIAGLDGASRTHIEDNGVTLLAPAAVSVTDMDTSDFAGGVVTASITSNAALGDVLEVVAGNGITLDGTDIRFNGNKIADFTQVGSSTQPMVITFAVGGDATANAVSVLMGQLGYRTTSDTPITAARTIEVSMTDGGAPAGSSAIQTVTMGVTPTNDAPNASGIPNTVTVTEDVATPVDLRGIAFSDADSGKGDVTVTLKASAGSIGLAASGALNLSGNGTDTITLVGAITDVNAYLNTPTNMLYTGAANAAGLAAANLTLSINDGGNSGAGGGMDIVVGKVGVDITPVNDAPVFTTAATLAVPENSLSVTTLAATDVDNLKLFYAIQGGADSALFSLDANSGALSFNTAPDFEVPTDHDKDGTYEVIVEASDGNGGTTPLTLAISVTDVDESAPPPPPAVNPIQISLPTPLQNTPSGQPSISETIRNTGSTSGSTKLVENSGNGNEVTVTLPGGVSLVNQGPRSALTSQQAQQDLMGSIGGQQPNNLADQAGIAERWLASRPDNTMLDIRTLVISESGNSTTLTPIQINGASGNGSGLQEAFIIDTSSLPNGNLIQLNHINFASVIGATRITGGAGDNMVIGDNAEQFIVLGAGDDELHGGGGNDVIGSQGGDDLLFGDAGNDRLFGGEGNDQLNGGSGVDVARFDIAKGNAQREQAADGSLTISSAATGVDTLTSIELLRFDDQVVLANAPELVTTAVASFDEAFYISRYSDVAEAITQGVFADARAHFQQYGRSEGRQAGPDGNGRDNLVFDEAFYLSQHTDVAAAVSQGGFTSGYAHYLQYGEREGRDPNVLFDEAGYRAANADVASALQQGNFASGYEHYRLFGEAENRNPSAWMDTTAYKETNPDIVATGIGALNHYMQFGIGEGRIITAADEGLWS